MTRSTGRLINPSGRITADYWIFNGAQTDGLRPSDEVSSLPLSSPLCLTSPQLRAWLKGLFDDHNLPPTPASLAQIVKPIAQRRDESSSDFSWVTIVFPK